MARPTKEVAARNRTKATITKALEAKGIKKKENKYIYDQVEEYMGFFDNLVTINSKLKNNFSVDLLKEKRQVMKEMRSILTFLGLKPSADMGDDSGEEL